jgi:hypothetical protein
MVEHWSTRFPSCRIVVTSRTVAYRPNSNWRLSDRFVEVELAPYTSKQIKAYVNNWYRTEAELRPQNFGGRDVAAARAKEKADALIRVIEEDDKLRSLVRQPLLLTLVALIHDRDKELPRHKAELYDSTVKLLQRWNIPTEKDSPGSRALVIDHDLVLRALQIVAFDLQRDSLGMRDSPPEISPAMLIERLTKQRDMIKQSRGHQAKVEELVTHLGTRNGILVSDKSETYRFLHLSLQEYLAACALIEQYDELVMPPNVKASTSYWQFPENICKLLASDPDRWRETALFAGSILANRKGQDERWHYIEELLPGTLPEQGSFSEGTLFSVYVAAEVWAADYLKVRLPSHELTRQSLRRCLELIITDSRLDVPEQQRSRIILDDLKKSKSS